MAKQEGYLVESSQDTRKGKPMLIATRACRCYRTLMLPVAVCVVILSASGPLAAEDLAVVLESYAKSASTVHSTLPAAAEAKASALREWRESWLEKIMVTTAASPGHEQYEQAVVACVGLGNSLGRSDLVRQLCQDLIDDGGDADLDLLAREQLLGLGLSAARRTADSLAIEDAFRQLSAIDAILDASSPEHAARRVRNLAFRAELHKVAGDPAAAARAYEEAAKQSAGLSAAAQGYSAGYDAEYLLFEKLRLDASAGAVGDVQQTLRSLREHAKRQEAGFYGVVAVQLVSQRSPAEARSLAEGLLARDSRGKHVPQMKHEIGKSYVLESDFASAKDVFEELLDVHEQELLKENEDQIVNGRDGLLSVVHFDLLQTYQRLGLTQEAGSLASRSEVLFPKNRAIRGMAAANMSTHHGDNLMDVGETSSAGWWRSAFIFLNAFALLGLGSVIFYRRCSSHS